MGSQHSLFFLIRNQLIFLQLFVQLERFLTQHLQRHFGLPQNIEQHIDAPLHIVELVDHNNISVLHNGTARGEVPFLITDGELNFLEQRLQFFQAMPGVLEHMQWLWR